MARELSRKDTAACLMGRARTPIALSQAVRPTRVAGSQGEDLQRALLWRASCRRRGSTRAILTIAMARYAYYYCALYSPHEVRMDSDISRLLRQRGHEVSSECGTKDILLPRHRDAQLIQSFAVVLYNLMRDDEVRKALRNWAYGSSNERSTSHQAIMAYITLRNKLGTSTTTTPEANQARYAKTFEWYGASG